LKPLGRLRNFSFKSLPLMHFVRELKRIDSAVQFYLLAKATIPSEKYIKSTYLKNNFMKGIFRL
jgi:hypothetical protein